MQLASAWTTSAMRRPASSESRLKEPMPKRRLAIIATHPIQYQVPWFQRLAQVPGIELTVYFALLPDAVQQSGGFGNPFNWDVPLLEGYTWEALINTSRHAELGKFWGLSTPGVSSVLRKNRPDAVVITGWHSYPLLQALWACLRLGIPRLIRGESNAMKPRTAAVKALHRLLLSRFDAFLTIGQSNREFYSGNGIVQERMLSCPYFVDNARFQQGARDLAANRLAIRRTFQVPEDCVCFLFVGKVQQKKRPLDLLKALDVLKAEGHKIHLLIVGTGELLDEAKRFAAERRLPASFAGFLNQSELPRAYVATDCLVLPSDYGETWGLVVNEAMACGLPALVSDRVGCGPDLIQDGVTGRVFPFGDVKALAKQLGELASRPDLLATMGSNARRRIGEYSVDNAVDGTLRALDWVLAREA